MIIIKKRTFFNFVIILVAIVVVCLGVIFINKIKEQNTSGSVKEKEMNALILKVSKLYLFPGDEVPTVAIVSDPKLLENQAFSTEAVKGDDVLFFKKAGRAVLYRPSINKIIEIALTKSN
jgi:hypothetical protein